MLAIDHRGHGRGLRSPAPFRLVDCADDAAGLLRTLGAGPVTAVGYSMGGPIASLLARSHPDQISGLVLCATAPDWSHPRMKRIWRSMAAFRGRARRGPERVLAARAAAGRLPRLAAYDLDGGRAHARQRQGHRRGRPRARALRRPALAVDAEGARGRRGHQRATPPCRSYKQRELAELLGAAVFEAPGDHGSVVAEHERFNARLLEALAHVGAKTPVAVA